MNSFYSQQGEDVYVLYNYINKRNPEGVFVELGGFDGLTYSNSKFFEDTLGFSGVLIEPTPQYAAMVKNRPKCKNYNLAVAGKHEMMMMIGDSAEAGLDDSMNPEFKQTRHQNSSSYLVEAKPFRDILKNSNITRIDLLIIDVEGGEIAVLETMDPSIPVYVIVIEMDSDTPKKNEECRVILRDYGFILDRALCGNEVWYNPQYPFIESVYFQCGPPSFKTITELGKFIYLESHCVKDVEDALRVGRRV
jgi:FkbM family methyltransferase